MDCPRCGEQVEAGSARCRSCGAELASPDAPNVVPVFATSNPASVPLAKSLLMERGIPYFAKGEEAEGLFPVGTAEFLVEFLVEPDRAEEARELLQDVDRPAPRGIDDDGGDAGARGDEDPWERGEDVRDGEDGGK